jgi:uncharacterized membrane protein YjgN (DUF898 family)
MDPAHSAAAVSLPVEPQPLTFTGSAREYFGIWIVNLALSVLTLGVYSAWAKVRRLQYFHRHTRLAGAPFDYHGSPIAILKGRIVAVNLLLIYTLAGQSGPVVALIAFSILAIALPWLLMRSFMFRLENTSYRGLRFRFNGSAAGAYGVFLGWPVLAMLTLFLLAPLCHHRIKRYQFSNAAYGATPFSYEARAGYFYGTYLAALGLLVALVLGGGVSLGLVVSLFGRSTNSHPSVAFLIAAFLIYGAIGLTLRTFIDALVRAHVWEHTWLGGRRVFCHIKTSSLLWIRATNIAATLLTFGLFVPFAQIRMARYLSSVFYVSCRNVDELAAVGVGEQGAFGHEAAGMFDFDIAM